MSIVTFIAGVIGPGVTAEAAKMALHDLILDKQDTISTTEGEEHKASEKDVSKDVMDEDTAVNACSNATAFTADNMPVNGPLSKPRLLTPSIPPALPRAISAATVVTTTPPASSTPPALLTPMMPTATATATYTAPPTSSTRTSPSALSVPMPATATAAAAAAISSSPPSHVPALFCPSTPLLPPPRATTNQSTSAPASHLSSPHSVNTR